MDTWVCWTSMGMFVEMTVSCEEHTHIRDQYFLPWHALLVGLDLYCTDHAQYLVSHKCR